MSDEQKSVDETENETAEQVEDKSQDDNDSSTGEGDSSDTDQSSEEPSSVASGEPVLKTYACDCKGNKTGYVEACDCDEACEKYKDQMGIIDSTHPITAVEYGGPKTHY